MAAGRVLWRRKRSRRKTKGADAKWVSGLGQYATLGNIYSFVSKLGGRAGWGWGGGGGMVSLRPGFDSPSPLTRDLSRRRLGCRTHRRGCLTAARMSARRGADLPPYEGGVWAGRLRSFHQGPGMISPGPKPLKSATGLRKDKQRPD